MTLVVNGYLVAREVFGNCHCFEQNRSFMYRFYDGIRIMKSLDPCYKSETASLDFIVENEYLLKNVSALIM